MCPSFHTQDTIRCSTPGGARRALKRAMKHNFHEDKLCMNATAQMLMPRRRRGLLPLAPLFPDEPLKEVAELNAQLERDIREHAVMVAELAAQLADGNRFGPDDHPITRIEVDRDGSFQLIDE
jgi:hypothetical protein